MGLDSLWLPHKPTHNGRKHERWTWSVLTSSSANVYSAGVSHSTPYLSTHTTPSHSPSHITHRSSSTVLLYTNHTPTSQPNTDNVWEAKVSGNTSNLRSQETDISEARWSLHLATLHLQLLLRHKHLVPLCIPSLPPTSLWVDASLGKPSLRVPMSVLVPPTSTTSAFFSPDSHIAPRMLLVGPEENVRMGNSTVRFELRRGGKDRIQLHPSSKLHTTVSPT